MFREGMKLNLRMMKVFVYKEECVGGSYKSKWGRGEGTTFRRNPVGSWMEGKV